MTALSGGRAFTRRLYSAPDGIANGGYTPIVDRLDEDVRSEPVRAPGIAAAAVPDGFDREQYDEATFTAGDYATGLCLLSPAPRYSLEQGRSPVTGGDLETYADVQQVLDDGVPELSQVTDQWGLAGVEGTVAVVVEDEEWTEKLAGILDTAGVTYDHEEVADDVQRTYQRVVDAFEAYVDVTGNNVDVLPVWSSDHSASIDELLEQSAAALDATVPPDDRYRQRVNMYFTPVWFDWLETEFGLRNISAVEPLRFLRELHDPGRAEDNIFGRFMYDYWSEGGTAAAPETGQDYDMLFVYPTLAPLGDGEDRAATLSGFGAGDNDIPAAPLDIVTPGHRLQEAMYRRRNAALQENPVVRLLGAFPQRQEEMGRLLAWNEIEEGQKPDWARCAASQGFEREEMGAYFDIQRDELAELLGGGDRTVFEQAFDAVADDIDTVMEASR
ncbi:MAG: hypothetical protein SVW77_03035 [Candidatus Nanohaloarchaea archaeon]|nr:hypothetical protein [Candidatus Nanohaloarchaea archaeon]